MSNLCFSQKLIDVTSKIGSGATPTGGENSYKKNGITFIRSQNVLDMSFSENNLAYIDEKQAEKLNNVAVAANDILLNITGDSIARCCIVPDSKLPARVNQHVAIVRPKNIEPYYLCYYLQFMKPYLLRICGIGGTRNALTKEIIGKIPLIRNRNESKIAHVLSSIDKMIGLNNKINAELEAMAKTIYDYWFLQFEFPNEEGKPYKSSGGKMAYNEELKREIPEGWTVKGLYECMDVVYGFPLSTELFSEHQGKNIIRIRDIPTNITTIKSEEKVDDKYLSKYKDLLIGMDGNFHMNFWCNDGDIINQRITRIREINNNISALQVFFTIEPYIKAIEKHVARSTVGHLSDKDIKSLKIICPQNKTRIYKVLNNILEKICTNKSENQELIALRDFLLPLLMNGQVSFKE